MTAKSIALLGLGNILLRDEGVGVKTVQQIQAQYTFSPPVKLIDGGTLGFALAHEVRDCSKLIVIDAVQSGEKPGTLYKFSREDITLKRPNILSAHDIGFLEVLEQWSILGFEPEVVFFGIEAKDISAWGTELSELISQKVPRIIELVLEELNREGFQADKIS